MKLGLLLAYSHGRAEIPMENILRAESAGFDSVWVAEAYGGDAISVAAWILARTGRIKVGTAICQVPGRTPTMTAMSAMSLAQLSGDRFILGLGVSGPQVVEGWHGVGFAKPLQRLRESIEIIRLIMAREGPVSYEGQIYQLPYNGPGSVGLGKPLKSLLSATSTPIYTASFTPAGFGLGGEIADGLIPAFASPEKLDLITGHVERGFAKAVGAKSWSDFDIAPFIHVYQSDDPGQSREETRSMLALYVGGMGAREKNFYNTMAIKMGYGDAARRIQDLYLQGKKQEAAAAVPDAFIDEISITGTREQMLQRVDKWKQAEAAGYVKSVLLRIRQPEVIDFMVEAFNR